MPSTLIEPDTHDPLAVIDALLAEQQTLTAVDRFSRAFDHDAKPAQSRYYRDLIPLSKPAPGEQYAFEVDLDACSGCKACVTACHNLNGLDDDEAWRDVGVIVGGTVALPIYQHVTTACHHCVEPACLEGCPVKAYDKDIETGIVRHLDDQCIGCQYCVLKCPYDVPKYNKSRGIVRKCDMCSSRLADQEAPACVQSCPNQAIRIRIVKTNDAISAAATGDFLPGAPEPSYTVPTTRYKSMRVSAPDVAPVADERLRPQPAHVPLTLMLVLTQISVGLLLAATIAPWLVPEAIAATARVALCIAATASCVAGLVVSTFHLGRPLYAFRAVLGLRTSWLSREIVVFGGYAGLLSCATMGVFVGLLDAIAASATTFLFVTWAVGVTGVFCSAMIYVDTRRPFWRLRETGPKFLLTMTMAGAAGLLIALPWIAAFAHEAPSDASLAPTDAWICVGLIAMTLAKLGVEYTLARRAARSGPASLMQSVALMAGPFRKVVVLRNLLGCVGGIILPTAFVAASMTISALSPLTLVLATLIAPIFFAGELIERHLFFRVVDAPRMPGTGGSGAHVNHSATPATPLRTIAIGGMP